MDDKKEAMQCEHCHAELAPQTKRRGAPRRFCSAPCRLAAHRARDALAGADRKLQRKALRSESVKQTGTLASDLMRGADEIAEELFGDPAERRRIYGLPNSEKKALGIFHIGKMICARRSTIRERIAAREAGVAPETGRLQ